jgi:hypothetical protein
MGARDLENLDAEDMFNEKDRRNPLVLCGAIATAGVLCAGLLAFRKGDFNRSQQMMRARVGFQAATVALMVGTVYLQGKSWSIYFTCGIAWSLFASSWFCLSLLSVVGKIC